jgi:hypothetical protein
MSLSRIVLSNENVTELFSSSQFIVGFVSCGLGDGVCTGQGEDVVDEVVDLLPQTPRVGAVTQAFQSLAPIWTIGAFRFPHFGAIA